MSDDDEGKIGRDLIRSCFKIIQSTHRHKSSAHLHRWNTRYKIFLRTPRNNQLPQIHPVVLRGPRCSSIIAHSSVTPEFWFTLDGVVVNKLQEEEKGGEGFGFRELDIRNEACSMTGSRGALLIHVPRLGIGIIEWPWRGDFNGGSR